MKAVILAGGKGTRLSEETTIRPKPMVEIGGKPILWHIMKLYSFYGINEFVICLGYKGYQIKEYFANYFMHQSDVTIDIQRNHIEVHNSASEPWKVTLVDTGVETMTGGRIKRIESYVDGTFLLTYGDAVSDIDISKLISFHHSHGKAVTMTAIQPEGRYGALEIGEKDRIEKFIEKPKGEGGWVNGGFFVCDMRVFDYIKDDPSVIFEREPLESLATDGELHAYKYYGFWKCMDTLRDKHQLDEMWETSPKWKLWDKQKKEEDR